MPKLATLRAAVGAIGRVMRWRVVDKETHFIVMCERPKAHISISYGDNSANIPIYGTRNEARLDAELICLALNRRDTKS